MALRATALGDHDARESLDSIAVDFGVSRETVRRARNQLLEALRESEHHTGNTFNSRQTPPGEEPTPAAARALKRVLTMTGPLPWDEVLAAWARAKGKHPYVPLPSDIHVMRNWLLGLDGLRIATVDHGRGVPVVKVDHPEPLDRVSAFLHRALLGRPEGVERSELFDAAGRVGLSAATIANTLSQHPAVLRLGRSAWSLRGYQQGTAPQAKMKQPQSAPPHRPQPTRFTWDPEGDLVLEFSVPRGPSPVVAVPRAVSDLLEGRNFEANVGGRQARLSFGRGRLWGFAPLLPILGVIGGMRVRLSIDLLTGTADLTPIPS